MSQSEYIDKREQFAISLRKKKIQSILQSKRKMRYTKMSKNQTKENHIRIFQTQTWESFEILNIKVGELIPKLTLQNVYANDQILDELIRISANPKASEV